MFRNWRNWAKILRRRLRSAYGKDSLAAIEAGQLHRSAAAKRAFANAEKLGDLSNLVVFPIHLLSAALDEEDVKRDSVMAGMGIDKALLCLNTKRELFGGQNVDKSEATKRIRLN